MSSEEGLSQSTEVERGESILGKVPPTPPPGGSDKIAYPADFPGVI